MTVRSWFRLQRAALWGQENDHAEELHYLAHAIEQHDMDTARMVCNYLIGGVPYRWRHLTRRAGSAEGVWR